jgi:hypothetical protein
MGFHKPSPITNTAKAICESLLAGKKRLRHVRRPQQGHHMSQKITGTSFVPKKITPAGRRKTSTELLHVTKITGTPFSPETERLRHVRRPQQGYYMSYKSQNVIFTEQKKGLRHLRRPQQGYDIS